MEREMSPLDAAAWKPLFDFLDHETRFQAAAAAITGAAAAWWLKLLIAPTKDANRAGAPPREPLGRISADERRIRILRNRG
jgi:hypothetical protein